jgi:hypothetical protein
VFTRARWFLFGVVATMGATAYVVTRVRRMRERLTPEAVVRAAAAALADVMGAAGRRLARPRRPDPARG